MREQEGSEDYVNVVLDTNVLVSGIISVNSPPARIVDALRSNVLKHFPSAIRRGCEVLTLREFIAVMSVQ